jgi:5-methylthioadenosine/S-adenosylhomocysteine deaminase
MKDEIGSLEPGKRADVIIVGMNSAHQTPLYNVYSHLAYATKASNVETVIINGRVVMLNRAVRTINEVAVRAKANEYRDKIRKSITP